MKKLPMLSAIVTLCGTSPYGMAEGTQVRFTNDWDTPIKGQIFIKRKDEEKTINFSIPHMCNVYCGEKVTIPSLEEQDQITVSIEPNLDEKHFLNKENILKSIAFLPITNVEGAKDYFSKAVFCVNQLPYSSSGTYYAFGFYIDLSDEEISVEIGGDKGSRLKRDFLKLSKRIQTFPVPTPEIAETLLTKEPVLDRKFFMNK